MSPESLERMRQALVDVVADIKGTANTASIEGIDVAGNVIESQLTGNK